MDYTSCKILPNKDRVYNFGPGKIFEELYIKWLSAKCKKIPKFFINHTRCKRLPDIGSGVKKGLGKIVQKEECVIVNE